MGYRNLLLGWASATALAVAACDGDFRAAFSPPDRASIPVHVETVSLARSRPALVVPAVVEAKSSHTLAFRASGRIARFRVEEGARVAVGDVIAELDLLRLEGELRSARTNLVRARARRLEAGRRDGRRRDLVELAAAASPRAESASIETLLLEAELRYALARVERSESRLAAGVLRAPAAGVVDRRYRGEGEAVPAGAPVVRLSELGNVVARASLPRALRPLLRIGGPAVVRVASDAADGLPAEIARVGGETGGANAEVAFEVRVENPSGVLRPGGVVAVEVAVEGPEALYTIPLSAVLRGIDARPFSFVVIGRGARARVERRHLVLGGFEGDRVAVVEGLAVGDRVVTRGQDLVTVGDPVAIVGEGP